MRGLDDWLDDEPDPHEWCLGPCLDCGACLSCERCASRCEYHEGGAIEEKKPGMEKRRAVA